MKDMQDSLHPVGYNYRSIYSDITMYRGFEGGAVYVARGAGVWVVITDESTLVDMLSDEDRAALSGDAIHICSFATETERNQFALSKYGQPRTPN